LEGWAWDEFPKPSSARVFVRTNSNSNIEWEQKGDPIIVDDGEGGVYEGYRVAIDGDTALISVRNVAQSRNAGLFVFERTGDVWEQTAMLHNSTPHYGEDILRIALEGNTGKLLISFYFNAL
jgi:predicted SPOUT superfamily RNA methylase MTH1